MLQRKLLKKYVCKLIDLLLYSESKDIKFVILLKLYCNKTGTKEIDKIKD